MKKLVKLLLTLFLLNSSVIICIFTGCTNEIDNKNMAYKKSGEESYLSKDSTINNKKVPYFYYDDYVSKKSSDESEVLSYLNTIKCQSKLTDSDGNNNDNFFYRDYNDGLEVVDMYLYEYIKIPETIEGKKTIKLGGTFENEFPESKGSFFYRASTYSSVGSYNVKTIYIPKFLKEIVNGSFVIDTLERIEVDENNPYYSSKDGILYDKSGKIQLCVPHNHRKKNTDRKG